MGTDGTSRSERLTQKVSRNPKAALLGLEATRTRARKDPSFGFQFLMRDEENRGRIKTAAHQEVFFEFAEAHTQCLIRLPPSFGKTVGAVYLLIRALGEDVAIRGAVISAAEGQAAKVTSLARDMIENRGGAFPEVRIVYPKLVPGDPSRDPWQINRFTIQRPAGIRDPSIVALGAGSESLMGSRLPFIIVDDVLNNENTNTPAGCDRVCTWFNHGPATRDSPGRESRIIVINTPWAKHTHVPGLVSKDLTYHLEEDLHWPSLTMDADGNIFVRNTDWDSDKIRPTDRHGDKNAHRLTAHDSAAYGAPKCVRRDGIWVPADDPDDPKAVHFDWDDSVVLWPEVWPREKLDKKQRGMSPIAYSCQYRMNVSVDGQENVPLAWINRCKSIAKALGYHGMRTNWHGMRGRVVTGVDLAFAHENKKSDLNSIFTAVIFPRIKLEVPVLLDDGTVYSEIPEGTRLPLRVEYGRWPAAYTIDKIIEIHKTFGGTIAVESVSAQRMLNDWALEKRVDLPLVPFQTGSNKIDVEYGVESIFYQFRNGAWLIPTDENDQHPEEMEKWLSEINSYRRGKHTGDILMSSWICSETMRKLDPNRSNDPEDDVIEIGGYRADFAATIGAR